jgi:V/A-type H+-transporting ATPase subunit C
MRVRTELTDLKPEPRSSGRMPDDLDRIATTLHGRRSRMAEAERLAELARARGLPELAQVLFPDSDHADLLGLQRQLVQGLIDELAGLLTLLSGPGARLMHWLLVRFQIENLKVLLRARFSGPPHQDTHAHLVTLPRTVLLDVQDLSSAESLDDFIQLAPKGLVRKSLQKSVELYGELPTPFFYEAVLDHGYLQVLFEKLEEIPSHDREIVRPMFRQEVDIFHLMLVTRGRFHYRLTPEMALPLHVRGARITADLFAQMLNDPDLRSSVGRAAEFVFDSAPFAGTQGERTGGVVDVPGLEHLAWRRFNRLANAAFRQSHTGLGAIIGYTGVRRVEVANLIMLSEGIRKGMPAETIRARAITYYEREAAYA